MATRLKVRNEKSRRCISRNPVPFNSDGWSSKFRKLPAGKLTLRVLLLVKEARARPLAATLVAQRRIDNAKSAIMLDN